MPRGVVQGRLMLVRVAVGAVGVKALLQVGVVGVELQRLHLVSVLQVLAELGGGTAHGGSE